MRTVLTIFCLTFLVFPSLLSQDLEEVLNRHYKAAAQERMSEVQTMVTRGENNMSMAGIRTTFVMYQSRPDKIRIEVNMQEHPVVQTYNGATGWILAPQMGISEPRALSADEIKALQEQAVYEDPLWNYKEKGFQLDLIAPDSNEGEYHMVMTDRENRETHFYLDKEDLLIRRYGTKKVLGGTEKNIEVLFEDYRTEHGIPMAHREITKMDGEVVNSISIDKIEFNRRLDPDLFEKPVTD